MQALSARRGNSQSKKPRFGKLTIDTGCPDGKQSLPTESRIPGLSFVSFEESKARRNVHASGDGIARPVEVLPADRRTIIQSVGRHAIQQNETNGPVSARVIESPQSIETLRIPLSDRVKGLRPAPLDIDQEVSPSDRAIPFGISFFSPSTIASAARSDSRCGHGADTPIILVTPADDHFPSDVRQRRPSSSVYSRYTNCAPKSARDSAPPVPPLPLLINTEHQNVLLSRNFSRKSVATTFEEDITPVTSRTAPESSIGNDLRRYPSVRSAELPTPRRSKGWWNIITSPFSARSTGGFFQRTPSLRGDHVPVLTDVQDMASSDPHAGLIFTNRALNDDELRSAPATSLYGTFGGIERSIPTRSDTAPGALDLHGSDFSIYDIPSEGEAAAYYDANRHFPSLYLGSKDVTQSPDDGLRDWSPSNSVFVPNRDCEHADGEKDDVCCGIAQHSKDKPVDEAFDQCCGKQAKEETPLLHSKQAVFTTPTPEELKSAGLHRKQSKRKYTQTTTDSIMSPSSATPIVQDAHLGRFVGPQSSHGEQRRVNVEVTLNPPISATGVARQEDRRGDWPSLLSKKTSFHVHHHRDSSHGLGISGSQQELFPPPQPLSEKPRLGTDKFGQLTIRSVEEEKPRRPWYRQYFWYLATAIGLLLVLLIVLLAVLVPRRHMATVTSTENSWFNLTGFPAVTVGVTGVIETTNAAAESSCVAPSSLWSCAVPQHDDNSIPTFKFEIKFRNGTLPRNETAFINSGSLESAESQRLMRRSLWSNSPFDPLPAPPSKEDQEFLGRTTDNSSQPYDGEETPFYISLLDSTTGYASSSPDLRKRAEDYQYPYPSNFRTSSTATSTSASSPSTTSSEITSTSSSKSSPTASSSIEPTPSAGHTSIPSPALSPNGSPLPQLLYPLVQSQPLRLYNRNQPTEHYGFYTYFDRLIYITNATSGLSNGTAIKSNVALEEASGVCTFSQTRFKVAIWTRRGFTESSSSDNIEMTSSALTSTSDRSLPGAFPYPVTFTIDRHGGLEERKGVYCYGIDEEGKVMKDGKMWVEEDRGADLVDPGAVPGVEKLKKRDENGKSDGSGIDGGTGDCACQWEG